ncbi:MAG: PDZ domain-containing protein [Caldilineales bacterium]
MGVVPPAMTASAGATIVDVVADSPAEAAGLQAGDVILSVNGEALGADNTLADAVAALQPGDSATLEVQRSGEDANLALDVTLGENPDNAGVAYLGVHFNQRPGARMYRMPFNGQDMPAMPNMPFNDQTMPNMPFFDHGAMPFGDVESGVVVVSVAADSPAAAAGLAEGDLIVAVDGTAVSTPEEVVAAIGKLKPGDVVTLSVQSSDANETDQTGEAETAEAVDVEVTLGARSDDATRAFLGVSLGSYQSMHAEEAFPARACSSSRCPRTRAAASLTTARRLRTRASRSRRWISWSNYSPA